MAKVNGPGSAKDGLPEKVTLLLVVAVSLVLVLAVIGLKFGPTTTTYPPSPQSASSTTFLDALQSTNATAASFPGGPWLLISAQGVAPTEIAAMQPLTSPTALAPSKGTIASCQALRGPTVWNTSGMPRFDGSLDSGMAPFWSMIYLNASLFLLQVQWVNGSVFAVPPLSPNSPCGYFAEQILDVSELLPLSGSSVAWSPYDSSLAGQGAWDLTGRSFALNHSALSQVYGLGQSVFNVMPSDVGWNVLYDSCPIVGGTAWIRPYAYADIRGPPGTPHVTINGTYGCWPFNWSVALGPGTEKLSAGGGEWVDLPVNVSIDWGLVTWMTSLRLNSSGNQTIDAARVSCVPSNISELACQPVGEGWLAALTSMSGGWLDVFAANGTGAGWITPNVTIYTGDSLAIYVPASVGLSGSRLTLMQTQSNIGIGPVSVNL